MHRGLDEIPFLFGAGAPFSVGQVELCSDRGQRLWRQGRRSGELTVDAAEFGLMPQSKLCGSDTGRRGIRGSKAVAAACCEDVTLDFPEGRDMIARERHRAAPSILHSDVA